MKLSESEEGLLLSFLNVNETIKSYNKKDKHTYKDMMRNIQGMRSGNIKFDVYDENGKVKSSLSFIKNNINPCVIIIYTLPKGFKYEVMKNG